ncbi:unnamed protein product [Sphenostylis stenocarpa]|uniref:Uncharacterized protein n=1 Tax=Sphenostylis stenocarpa TaxID=92480 RepID=A0AA86SVF9_9FABA|nr:unnamed protein product [Sphenostylis stenocarpa]
MCNSNSKCEGACVAAQGNEAWSRLMKKYVAGRTQRAGKGACGTLCNAVGESVAVTVINEICGFLVHENNEEWGLG